MTQMSSSALHASGICVLAHRPSRLDPGAPIRGLAGSRCRPNARRAGVLFAALSDTDFLHALDTAHLAVSQRGTSQPHPNAACRLVSPDGRLLSQAVLPAQGMLPPETAALAAAGSAARGATAFLNLEPWEESGIAALRASGISRVVLGLRHPLPDFSGVAVAALRGAGVEVDILGETQVGPGAATNGPGAGPHAQAAAAAGDGPEAPAAAALRASLHANEDLVHRAALRLPLSLLKYAMTLDGKIAASSGHAAWISSAASRRLVMEERAACDAVVVGGCTVRRDNPRLTSRTEGKHNPVRIVMSRTMDLPEEAHLWDVREAHTIVAVQRGARRAFQQRLRERGVEIVEFDFLSPLALAQYAYHRGFLRCLWECGGTLAAPAIQAGVIHKVMAFVAPKLIGGVLAPTPLGELGFVEMTQALQLAEVEWRPVGPDVVCQGYLPSSGGPAALLAAQLPGRGQGQTGPAQQQQVQQGPRPTEPDDAVPAAPAPAPTTHAPAAPAPAPTTHAPAAPAPAPTTHAPAAPAPAPTTHAPAAPAPAPTTHAPAAPAPAPTTHAPAAPAPAPTTHAPAAPAPAPTTHAPAAPAPAPTTHAPAAPAPAPTTHAPAAPAPAPTTHAPAAPAPAPTTHAPAAPAPAPTTHAPAAPAPAPTTHAPAAPAPAPTTHAPAAPAPAPTTHAPAAPAPAPTTHAPAAPAPAPTTHAPAAPAPAPTTHAPAAPAPAPTTHAPAAPAPAPTTHAPAGPAPPAPRLFYKCWDALGCLSNFSPHPVCLPEAPLTSADLLRHAVPARAPMTASLDEWVCPLGEGEEGVAGAAPHASSARLWPTSEHYYQAQKFAGVAGEAAAALRAAIAAAPSPEAAAALARAAQRARPRLVRPDWHRAKVAVMLHVLRAKFASHPDAAAALLGTGDAPLQEDAPHDYFWGRGLTGTGNNMLGRLLVQVRSELRAAGREGLLNGSPQNVYELL
ncbi:RFD2 [Auxenochlorella protothecoides x Auxenochlorella symbiontica]